MSQPRKEQSEARPAVTRPVDRVDGIPDRAAKRPAWKYVLIVVVFLAWVAFLTWVEMTGNVPPGH